MTLLTEDEAKTKRCCGPEGCGYTHTSATSTRAGERYCIASACIAWRWGQKRNPDWKPDHSGMMWPSPHPDDRPATHIRDTEHGYCGLSGRPS